MRKRARESIKLVSAPLSGMGAATRTASLALQGSLASARRQTRLAWSRAEHDARALAVAVEAGNTADERARVAVTVWTRISSDDAPALPPGASGVFARVEAALRAAVDTGASPDASRKRRALVCGELRAARVRGYGASSTPTPPPTPLPPLPPLPPSTHRHSRHPAPL